MSIKGLGGRVTLNAPDLPVINTPLDLFAESTDPDAVDFTDLLSLPDEPDTHTRIVERCMERIAGLAAQQRELRSPD